MKTKKNVYDAWAVQIPHFKSNINEVKRIARSKRMPVGSYIASVLEKEIKKEARRNDYC